jgi:hypothetical protein
VRVGRNQDSKIHPHYAQLLKHCHKPASSHIRFISRIRNQTTRILPTTPFPRPRYADTVPAGPHSHTSIHTNESPTKPRIGKLGYHGKTIGDFCQIARRGEDVTPAYTFPFLSCRPESWPNSRQPSHEHSSRRT